MNELLTREIIGYRQWLVMKINGEQRLCPLFTGSLSEPWTTGRHEARCHLMSGKKLMCMEPPGSDCTCGLYAYHEITDTMRRGHIKGRVAGLLRASGEIEVHHLGFRAQYAEILALAETMLDENGEERTKGVPELAKAYAVRLLPLEDLEEYGRMFGTPVPKQLIPVKQPVKPNPFTGPETMGWVG